MSDRTLGIPHYGIRNKKSKEWIMSASSSFIFQTSSLAMAQAQFIRFNRNDLEVATFEPAI